jgi:ArsR family transcriptional regulator
MNEPNLIRIAAICHSLGHSQRLAVFARLWQSVPKGCTFGDLCAQVNMPPSTLTHHLRELEKARLVERHSAGRSTVLHAKTTELSTLQACITALCCPPSEKG